MLLPMVPVIDDLLHFIFLLITNQLWWWVLELSSVFLGLFVRC